MKQTESAKLRAGIELFVVSALVLFLELACIRWFPAHVIFLTFFTNMVLLASFLGMSVGCLMAGRKEDLIVWTAPLLAASMLAAHFVEEWRYTYAAFVNVGHQRSPQMVFFGTEYSAADPGQFVIPIEVVGAFFFLVIALAMLGPGQELGRALKRVPGRVQAYTINIGASIAGILLFATCSFLQLPPLYWFVLVIAGVAFCLRANANTHALGKTALSVAGSAGVLYCAFLTSGIPRPTSPNVTEHYWSPYYRVDFLRGNINVNLIGHQFFVPREKSGDESAAYAYSVPYLLRRDSGGAPFKDVLIIGAGSGNDVSRALQWGAEHVDAVEIDPRIYRIGKERHPDRPYDDPRVTVHLDDGRQFLRTATRQYDLIVFALVDSLVLHSGYSNIRLESYLFTAESMADVRARLKPGGDFVMYNYFRQGWIVDRLFQSVTTVFHEQPLVLPLPYVERVTPDFSGGFTILIAGNTGAIRSAFGRSPRYWMRAREAPTQASPNGFSIANANEQNYVGLGLATVEPAVPQRIATDTWPFLYLRSPMIPTMNVRSALMMALLALGLIWAGGGHSSIAGGQGGFSWRLFFLGAGFMLIECKAVVQMALLFGGTWMVNTIVFLAVLVMILASNLYVLYARPRLLTPYYVFLIVSLALNAVVPLGAFWGATPPLQLAGPCLLVFAPVLFAGVIFAVTFGQSRQPDRDFGANIAGAMLGGLSEYSSMLIGFKYLSLVAVAYYLASAIFGWGQPEPSFAERRETNAVEVREALVES